MIWLIGEPSQCFPSRVKTYPLIFAPILKGGNHLQFEFAVSKSKRQVLVSFPIDGAFESGDIYKSEHPVAFIPNNGVRKDLGIRWLDPPLHKRSCRSNSGVPFPHIQTTRLTDGFAHNAFITDSSSFLVLLPTSCQEKYPIQSNRV